MTQVSKNMDEVCAMLAKCKDKYTWMHGTFGYIRARGNNGQICPGIVLLHELFPEKYKPDWWSGYLYSMLEVFGVDLRDSILRAADGNCIEGYYDKMREAVGLSPINLKLPEPQPVEEQQYA